MDCAGGKAKSVTLSRFPALAESKQVKQTVRDFGILPAVDWHAS